MAHKIRFFEKGTLVDTLSLETWDIALAAAQRSWRQTGNVFSASITPDHTKFNNLAEYIEAENASANWLATHPQEGCFITALTTSLSYWDKIRVRTPEELAKRLAIETYSDMHKEVNGFRPRADMSDLPIEEIHRRIDCLSEARRVDAS